MCHLCTKSYSGPEFVWIENEKIMEFYMKSRHHYKNCMIPTEKNRIELDCNTANVPNHLEQQFFREEDTVPQFMKNVCNTKIMTQRNMLKLLKNKPFLEAQSPICTDCYLKGTSETNDLKTKHQNNAFLFQFEREKKDHKQNFNLVRENQSDRLNYNKFLSTGNLTKTSNDDKNEDELDKNSKAKIMNDPFKAYNKKFSSRGFEIYQMPTISSFHKTYNKDFFKTSSTHIGQKSHKDLTEKLSTTNENTLSNTLYKTNDTTRVIERNLLKKKVPQQASSILTTTLENNDYNLSPNTASKLGLKFKLNLQNMKDNKKKTLNLHLRKRSKSQRIHYSNAFQDPKVNLTGQDPRVLATGTSYNDESQINTGSIPEKSLCKFDSVIEDNKKYADYRFGLHGIGNLNRKQHMPTLLDKLQMNNSK